MARLVAIAIQATNNIEKQYPQLDLEEVMSVDFGFRMFHKYLVGSPQIVTVVSNHKTLVTISNRKHKDSIRTQYIIALKTSGYFVFS